MRWTRCETPSAQVKITSHQDSGARARMATRPRSASLMSKAPSKTVLSTSRFGISTKSATLLVIYSPFMNVVTSGNWASKAAMTRHLGPTETTGSEAATNGNEVARATAGWMSSAGATPGKCSRRPRTAPSRILATFHSGGPLCKGPYVSRQCTATSPSSMEAASTGPPGGSWPQASRADLFNSCSTTGWHDKRSRTPTL
mmetsp:Transcript_57519/g.175170  ORF Transcript_57519/g.175170 Transcript_57519/m.175170 type:complete len:200 (-) Transcript_57519:657-1256(-)